MTARLILGDSVQVLREQFAAGSVDMVYSDPPFGNQQVWTGKAGSFDDRWSWGHDASAGWAALRQHNPAGADLMAAVAPDENTRGYLGFMAGLLIEVRRVLRPTGTLWLHFDDTMGAELRILGDMVFGPTGAFGTIIWKRTTAHADARCYGRIHDTIAVFGRSRVARWRLARCGDQEFVSGDPALRTVRVDGYVDVRLAPTSGERVGYPTQKPVALIKRFISAATLPGDLVLDPTCGSGTTAVAALELGRRAVAIDRSADAIATAGKRVDAWAEARPRQADLFAEAA